MAPEPHVRRFGTGPRRAHLIHCNLATGKAWAPLMQVLDAELAAEAVDMLGQGRSPMPDRTRDYQLQCAEASIAVMQRSGPQDLIGHSFGGCIALKVAHMRPDLVRTLTLFEPVFFGFLDDADHPVWQAMKPGQQAFYDTLTSGDTMAAAAKFLTEWGMPGEWERMPDDARRAMADRMWLIAAQRGSIVDDNNWRLRLPDLATLEMPTLVMHGEQSPPVMAEMTKIIVKTMPNASGAGLPGAGHMLPITHAGAVADHLHRFWNSN